MDIKLIIRLKARGVKKGIVANTVFCSKGYSLLPKGIDERKAPGRMPDDEILPSWRTHSFD
jgi:hypothetical protein